MHRATLQMLSSLFRPKSVGWLVGLFVFNPFPAGGRAWVAGLGACHPVCPVQGCQEGGLCQPGAEGCWMSPAGPW